MVAEPAAPGAEAQRGRMGLLGRKLGMGPFFTKAGGQVGATVVEAGPCTVLRVRSAERDGYTALQLGFADAKRKRLTKPRLGEFAKLGQEPKRFVREVRLADLSGVTAGQTLDVELFAPGDLVDVTGTSIGKGFQGGVKRWHWRGGRATRGSMHHRRIGSVGASSDPSRVFKGHHMPGRMGGDRVTVQALEVLEVQKGRHVLVLKGAVPGRDGGFLVIRRSRTVPRPPAPPPRARKAAGAAKTAQKAVKPAAKTPAKKP